ncbi:MAG: hypothetical protein WC881_05355, partial [Elusimicrobiota bacterium]
MFLSMPDTSDKERAASVSPEELRRCAEILEAVVADRTQLAEVSQEERVRLLQAAGRVCRPTRWEAIKLSRGLRLQERLRAEAADRS